MTLNASGPIILAGTTAGQSIEIELGGSGTAQISLNCTTVRTLAGVPSGAIIMPTNFYGKGNAATFYGGGSSNLVTRINACGALVGSETNVGTARGWFAGATVGSNGLFYGGANPCSCCFTSVNLVTRINACGALVGSETNVGTTRAALAGAKVGANGLFYGGYCACSGISNLVTRINACGALVGSQTSVGTARDNLAGATVGANGLFYGGYASGVSNLVTRINACGALVGSQTNVGTARFGSAGAGS